MGPKHKCASRPVIAYCSWIKRIDRADGFQLGGEIDGKSDGPCPLQSRFPVHQAKGSSEAEQSDEAAIPEELPRLSENAPQESVMWSGGLPVRVGYGLCHCPGSTRSFPADHSDLGRRGHMVVQ